MIGEIAFRLLHLKRFEHKLRDYHGYRHDSIVRWKRQMGISWKTATKVLEQLKIVNAREIRQMLQQVTAENKDLFNSKDCYVCKFGRPGKSGDILLYEFKHGCPEYSRRIVNVWEIPSLPEKSRIVFVDDLVGTGAQSVGYIYDTLNLFLNASHEAYLLFLCGTPQGIVNVRENSNFTPMCCLVLDEEHYQHYSKSEVFNDNERQMINRINDMLKAKGEKSFDKGLLLAFYYSVPNNTMPFIWKDDFQYADENGKLKKWYAILPRRY